MKKRDYSAPVAKVFEVRPQSLICQSPNGVIFGNNGEAGVSYGDDNIDDYGDL